MRWMRMCAPHLLLRLAQPWLQPLPCMPRMLLRWPPSALHAWHPRLHLQLPRLRRRRLRPRRLGCARDGHATCGRGCNDRSRDDFAGARSRLACACCGRRRGRAACSFAGGWCSSRQAPLLAATDAARMASAAAPGSCRARGGGGCVPRRCRQRARRTRLQRTQPRRALWSHATAASTHAADSASPAPAGAARMAGVEAAIGQLC